ncbi:hypothetical protein [Carboxylicivirga sp. M1479]|uniref:hypothetical protein n=1 Tax=Carboxylicivirga sp. M1479 TaxID=2594476 RepID=UPI001C8F3C99|nr:hypothetical protein [Carboxylicivirga sp. M1479]
MAINETKDYLNRLQENSTEKRDIKVYQKFIRILTSIESRGLPTHQIDLIEKELSSLDLNQQTKNRKKYIKKKLNEFLKFLDSEFSFVLKGHYANYCLSIGIVLGVAIGTSVFRDSGGSTTGMCFGMLIGYFIGLYLDNEAAKNNRVLTIA